MGTIVFNCHSGPSKTTVPIESVPQARQNEQLPMNSTFSFINIINNDYIRPRK